MSATQDDIRRILLSLREMRERVDAIEAAVAGIAAHVGWAPPSEPAAPALPADVEALLERGDRRGAVLALARARGVSKHVAEQELQALGL